MRRVRLADEAYGPLQVLVPQMRFPAHLQRRDLISLLLDPAGGRHPLGAREAAGYRLIAKSLRERVERAIELLALRVGARSSLEQPKLL